MVENLYNVLGISEDATREDIKKAYRTLQMKYHPDKNSNSVESIAMTQKINEVYEVLSDEQKKSEYDMMRRGGSARHFKHGEDVPLDDIFNMFFGGNPFAEMRHGEKIHIFHGGPMGFQQAMSKPIPIIKSMQISIEQVLNGASLPLEIERWIIENGNKVFEKETIYIEIPPGIDENEIIVLRDKGNIISEQCKGDIKINIVVQNNTLFKRVGLDLILEKQISLKESLCGFNFVLKHLNGKNYTLNNHK